MIHEVYEVIPNTPTKNGSYKEYDKQGTLIEKAQYKSGDLHGLRVTYYNAFLSGSMDTPSDWYGNVMEEIEYKNGKAHGSYKFYKYSNGGKVMTTSKVMVQGNPVEIKEYYDSGKPKSVEVVNGECKGWYESGQLAYTYTRHEGIIEGEQKEWNEKGILTLEGIMRNGTTVGTWKSYFDNGELYRVAEYSVNGNISTLKEYGENGGIKYELNERFDDKLLLRVEYSPEGSVRQKSVVQFDPDSYETTKNGGEEEYYADGSLKRQTQYLNGKLSGDHIEYDKSGNITVQGKNQYGHKVGEWKYYHNGELQAIEVFDDWGNSKGKKSLEQIKEEQEMANAKQAEEDAKESIPTLRREHDQLYTQLFEAYGGYEKSREYPSASAPAVIVYSSKTKKHLFEAYLKVAESIDSRLKATTTNLELANVYQQQINLDKKMLSLLNQETKELEKSLKKLENTEQIMEIILSKS
jgi:antitoxin component YwqK of YwqJK toxin-antitoxin module